MRRLIVWGLTLYPASWRARYGDEFLALIEDTRPRGRDAWDVLRGAMLMHWKSLTFTKIVGAFGVVGMLAAGVWGLTLPDQYVSRSVLRMESMSPVQAQQRLAQAQQVALSRRSLAEIIQQENLYPDQRKRDTLEAVIQEMRNQAIRITPHGTDRPVTFAVEFSYPDAGTAQKTTRHLVGALTAVAPVIEVVDQASVPGAPVGPNRIAMVGRGLLAGLVVGVLCAGVYAIVRRQRAWSAKRIGAFAAAGMVLGATIAFLIPDQFISNAVLRASDESTLQTATERAMSPDALAAIVRKYGLYHREAARSEAQNPASRMRKDVLIRRAKMTLGTGLTPVIVVSFIYPDRFKAQAATRELVAGIIQANGNTGAIEVLDPPSDPQTPSSPNRLTIIALGVFLGVLLGLAATRFRRPAEPAMA